MIGSRRSVTEPLPVVDNDGRMDMLLGLPGLKTIDVVETNKGLTCTLELVGDLPDCPDCGSDRRRVHGPLTYRAWDTPMRGKPTRLVIKRPRYRCRCGATFAKTGDVGIDAEFPSMTTRLVQYIQGAVLRRPNTVVAAETGVSSTNVGKIAGALAEKLYHHKFPTPEVLAIDDIRIRRKLFTVVTDGQTGKAMPSCSTPSLNERAKRHPKQRTYSTAPPPKFPTSPTTPVQCRLSIRPSFGSPAIGHMLQSPSSPLMAEKCSPSIERRHRTS